MSNQTSTSMPFKSPDKKGKSKLRIIFFTLFLLVLSIPILKVTLLPPPEDFDGYNYSSFRDVANENRSNGPNPGDDFPVEYDIYDMIGEPIKISTLWSDKPLVLEFGSVSCPIFHANGPSMEDLYKKYDNGSAAKARIGLLYTREAHPGWFQSSHASLDDKLTSADKLKKKGLERTIWVDSLSGELHQLLNPKPNSLYIINTDGTVIYKSAWNTPVEVDRVLDNLVNKQIIPAAEESNFCSSPVGYYPKKDMLAYISRIFAVGGPDALPDFIINDLFADSEDSSDSHCLVEL